MRWVLALLCVGFEASASAMPRALLDEGIASYEAGLEASDPDARLELFARAEGAFRRLIGSGFASADLYTNLGNAALQAEHLGAAVLAYRRALALDPDHDQARANLEHARGFLPEWVARPRPSAFWDSFFFWHTSLSRAEKAWTATGLWGLAALLLAFGIALARPALRSGALLPGLAWAGLCGSLWISGTGAGRGEAVVRVPEVVARSADSSRAPLRFAEPLPGGTELQIVERRDAWVRAELANGRDAWLPSESLALVESDG